jgi:hypothetical protein
MDVKILRKILKILLHVISKSRIWLVTSLTVLRFLHLVSQCSIRIEVEETFLYELRSFNALSYLCFVSHKCVAGECFV